MKPVGKILLAMFFTAVGVFATITIIKDYRNGDGAFMSDAKYRGLTARAAEDEETVAETETEPETGHILSEESDEQEASEEDVETVQSSAEEMVEEERTVQRMVQDNKECAEVENEEPHILETDSPGDANDGVFRGNVYQICGVELDPEIGDYLVAELKEHNIEFWLPIALAQIFQESRMDPLARNKNNLDMGILQYRVTYWDWSRGDIFDWRAQISLYVEQTARRLSQGCSIWETVSRHNTSDYGAYNQEYVDQVFQWVPEE